MKICNDIIQNKIIFKQIKEVKKKFKCNKEVQLFKNWFIELIAIDFWSSKYLLHSFELNRNIPDL